MRCVELLYDVPQRSTIKNPSDRLRSLGVRHQLSAWIIPERNVPALQSIISEILGVGGKAELLRYDERDTEKIIRLAQQALTEDVEGMRQDLEDGLGVLRKELAKLEPGQEKEWTNARSKAYRSIRRAKLIADSAWEAALAFDLLGNMETLIGGLRALTKARSELYFSAVEEARVIVFPRERSQQQRLGVGT